MAIGKVKRGMKDYVTFMKIVTYANRIARTQLIYERDFCENSLSAATDQLHM